MIFAVFVAADSTPKDTKNTKATDRSRQAAKSAKDELENPVAIAAAR